MKWIYLTTVLCMVEGQKYARNSYYFMSCIVVVSHFKFEPDFIKILINIHTIHRIPHQRVWDIQL